MKKPIYKKVWFWLLLIVLFLGIGAASKPKNGVINSNTDTSKKDVKSEGKLGDTISFDGVDYVVTNQQSKTGLFGDKIITYDVSAKNNSGATKYITSTIFKLIDENGTVLDATVTEKTNQLFKELPNGTNSSGEMAFKDNGKKLKEIQMTQIGEATVTIKL